MEFHRAFAPFGRLLNEWRQGVERLSALLRAGFECRYSSVVCSGIRREFE